MVKNISSLGTALSKAEQKSIHGEAGQCFEGCINGSNIVFCPPLYQPVNQGPCI
jgi:hypothetical protein